MLPRILARSATALAVLLTATGLANAACRADRAEIVGPEGAVAAFRVEIADEPAERQQGLMNRESMGLGEGMLFVFPQQRPLAFWMRNTLIPLDIIFFDETGALNVIQHGKPLDETSLPGGDSQYVLEINGGLAERMGIGEGSVLRHPAVDQDLAAAPCD
ncbi:DUF192 domain-containing protein [Pseudooceanicola marinus]|uniref:DUF192 domain-containing protein n=1 Tax=Pseudooceanicola marinus TaxID=396013 RepID=UPI001CD3F81C|nr:DUF192 domain-containing protein [Pseudooceanicola marinus]MCA1334647.1 DUF192 domain-containing protein [Pseudooceanicola marinus]